MKKSIFVIVVLVLCACFLVQAQESPIFSLDLLPGAVIPIMDSTMLFTIGGGTSLFGEFDLPSLSFLRMGILIDYYLLPTKSESLAHLLAGGAGAGIALSFIPNLNVSLLGFGGYSVGLFQDVAVTNPFAKALFEVDYQLIPNFSLGIGASYNHYFALTRAQFQGIGIHLNAAYTFAPVKRRPKMEIPEMELSPLFPVFAKYYDNNPLGKIKIRNSEKGSIKNVAVSFFVKEYMDSPKVCTQIDEMKQGEEKEVTLYALFSNDIMTITESTKVQAEIIIEYTYMQYDLELKRVETLRIYDRNAMTWDDDRKAASFITSKDPVVLKFSKAIAGITRQSGGTVINSNFKIAMGLYEALRSVNMQYVPDPKTPYIEFSKNESALDFLQFPRQSLRYKAGDCDDLSILFCALLESVGVETAFVTIPGHIFMAFSLDINEKKAKKVFKHTEDIIYIDGKAWIPFEITLLQDGFLKAWQVGAREWKDNKEAGKTAFYKIHEAWSLYEPVGITGDTADIVIPDLNQAEELFLDELTDFVKSEIKDKENALQEKIKRSKDHRFINKLGILYAQYGLFDEALAVLEPITQEQGEYVPALINLGFIHCSRKDYNNALEYFERAYRKRSNQPLAVAGLCLANYELKNYGSANKYLEELEMISPKLAEKYDFVSSEDNVEGRALAQDIVERLDWADEE